MAKSKWDAHGMESKIRAVLASVPENRDDNGKSTGRPFITAYQLAVAVDRQHPGLSEKLGKRLGGEGIGEHNSLTQYIAGQLAQRIGQVEIRDVEREFLDVRHTLSLEFDQRVRSSVTGVISMFRLRHALD